MLHENSTPVLPWTTVPQSLVPIQFQVSPVQVATGNDALFTLQTITDTFSITWLSPGGSTLGQWVGGQAVLNSVAQYMGRLTITATQLKISACQLTDAGNYTASVIPSATTGLSTSFSSVALKVFDAVTQVSLFVPSVAIEGRNVTLRCSWASGSGVSVAWSKGGSSLPLDPHVTVNSGLLTLNPASRSDAGLYSCIVSNPVSTQMAMASLTVNYGPDTPQVTKTSSGCVGGGDAMVGQTVQLTCTSVSLPPALLSWQYGGKPLITSQQDGGTLNLQVFSTNQSGQYVCTARNSVTAGTSQQMLTVTVVGTCLSAGAVAGIVVGCFVALVLIIVAIVLILRQRNVDRRLRDVVGVQKTNLNTEPPVLLPLPNRLVTSGTHGYGDQRAPPLHNPNRHQVPRDPQTSTTVWHTGQANNGMLIQDRLHASQHNDQANAGTFPNNDHRNSSCLPYNGHQNSNLFPHNSQHNSSSFPQSGQENPDILIQTGRADPGGHTVLINLSNLAHGQQGSGTMQPHMVHVNLASPHRSPAQPIQNPGLHSQQSSTLQHSYPSPPTQTIRNMAQSASDRSLGNGGQDCSRLVQTDCSYPTNQRLASYASDPVYPQPETRHRPQNQRRSSSNDRPVSTSTSSTPLRQMPWDRLRGTPAYPNAQVDESDSSDSLVLRNRLPRSDPQRMRSSQTPRQRSAEDRRMQPASLAPSGRVQRQEAQQHSRTDVNGLSTQPNVNSLLPAGHHNPVILPHGTQQTTVPQNHTTQTRTTQPMHAQPDDRPAIPFMPHSAPLLQAELELHTRQASNPFTIRNQPTQVALQTSGPSSAHPHPTTQLNHQGPRPPTPPPVLRPTEFQTLPRKPLQQENMAQPARRPDRQGHARDHRGNPQRHAGNHQMHVTRHDNVHRHPPRTNQFHRSRPRH